MKNAKNPFPDLVFKNAKSDDDSGEKGKLLNPSNSPNENGPAGELTALGNSRRSQFSSPRNVRMFFFIFMLMGLIFFSIIPIVSLLSLKSLYQQINEGLQEQVLEFIKYYHLILDVDEISVLLFYFTYLKDPTRYTKMVELSESSSNYTFEFLDKFCSVLEGCSESVSASLYTSYTTFVETSLPAFKEEVTSRLATLETYASDSSLRDTLINTLVTADGQAALSRGTYMVASAKLSCFSIASCWTNTDAQNFFTNAETIVGNMLGSLVWAVNDIFSVIEDPRLGETTAADVIAVNNVRNMRRNTLIDSLDSYITQATTLFNEVSDASTVPTNLRSLFFVLPPDWAATILASLNSAKEFAVDINSKFLQNFGITSTTPTGVDDALAMNISQAEVMSLAESLKSYFAYDVGEGLTMSIPDDEIKEIETAFNSTLMSYLNTLQAQVSALYLPVLSAFGSLMYTEDVYKEQSSLLKMILPTFILCCFISFGFYLGALILVRYHLTESPLGFRYLLCIVAVLFAFQVGMSILVVVKVALTPLQKREFTFEFMLELNERCKALAQIGSMITRRIVETALLIAPSYTAAEDFMDYFTANLNTLITESEGKEWHTGILRLSGLYQSLLKAGFYSLRQCFTAASSLSLTSAALADAFGITTINGAPATAPEACQVLTGASAMGQLNSVFYTVSAIREKLASGTTSLDSNHLIDEYSSATLETSCLISYVMYENNKEECYDPSTCDYPSSYGLLRSRSESGSMYSVFDPFSSDSLGTLFSTLNSVRSGFYNGLDDVHKDAAAATDSDAQIIDLNRRFVVWTSVFTFLIALSTMLMLRTILFGNSFFSIFG